MLDALRQRTVAKVLFDEHHGEAWSIRPEVAARIQPAHPAAASYSLAAEQLARARLRRARHLRLPSRCGVAGRRRRARDRASQRSQMGAHGRWRLAAIHSGGDRRGARLRSLRRRPHRPRRRGGGQVRRQPERAAGAVRGAVPEHHRVRLPPGRRRALMDHRRARDGSSRIRASCTACTTSGSIGPAWSRRTRRAPWSMRSSRDGRPGGGRPARGRLL